MKMGIRSKILLSVGACILASFSIVTIIIINTFSKELKHTVIESATNLAGEYSNFTTSFLYGTEIAARANARIAETAVKDQPSRSHFLDQMANQARGEDNWVDVWACFEKNAFDGNDINYLNDPLNVSLSDGTFAFLVSIDNQTAIAEPLYYEGEEYYEPAKKTKNLYVTDPYQFEINGMMTLLTTLAYPIIQNNEVIGVTGIDVSLDELNKTMRAIRPYEQGYLRLLSSSGTYIVHEDDAKVTIANNNEKVKQAIFERKIITEEISDKLFIYYPVEIKTSGQTWLLELEIPMDVAMATANESINSSIKIIVIITFFILVLLFFIANSIVGPLKFLKNTMVAFSKTGNVEVDPATLKRLTKISRKSDETGAVSKALQEVLSMLGNKKETLDNISNGNLLYENQCISLEDSIGNALKRMLTGLQAKSQALESISDGDLRTAIVLQSEADTMGLALQKMSNNLIDIVSDIQTATNQVALSSKELAKLSVSLATGAEYQTNVINEFTETITTLQDKTNSNLEMAENALKLTLQMEENAAKSTEQMDAMVVAVDEISQSNYSISNIVELINSITRQTNLLALNASIEAARAGEHGKGFAIVANEVRELAEKSEKATKEIEGLISDSLNKTRLGVELVAKTRVSLTDIVDGINESNNFTNKIASSSEEQAMAIKQLTTNIKQISSVIHENGALAQESSASVQVMDEQTDSLNELVKHFKMK